MNETEKFCNTEDCTIPPPEKEFETIVFNLRELVSLQQSRLSGLQRLSDKLIGKSSSSEGVNSMPKTNTTLDSFQGQIEESIIILSTIGNDIDKVLEKLHDKI